MPNPETPKSQIDKFRETARQLETDDDEKRFDERLKKVAKALVDRKAGENNSGRS